MISRLYVFAPLEGDMLLCGRIDRDKVGDSAIGRFRYSQQWLRSARAFALDPRNLPLTEHDIVFTENGGIPAVLEDAGPDNWGKRLLSLERPDALQDPLEILRLSNGRGTGALLFSQSREKPAPARPWMKATSLDELESTAQKIAQGEVVRERELRMLFEAGSSLGGARPKANIVRNGQEWIAKFARADDPVDIPRLEWCCLRLARMIGIETPEHILEVVNGRTTLLVQRFDRTQKGPKHFLSLHALLSKFRVNAGDTMAPLGAYTYGNLASLCRHAGVASAGHVLFERMLFNVVVGNTDDHLRNHGLLYADTGWAFSPLFDVVALGGAQQAIGIGKLGRNASVANAMSDLPRFGLDLSDAAKVLALQLQTLERLEEVMHDSGMSSYDQQHFRAAMRVDEATQWLETTTGR